MRRQEYPRPQLVRKDWVNLNGTWNFSFDDQNIGLQQGWHQDPVLLKKKIDVPFAYQTELSGIHDPSFHDWVWYSRQFTVPSSWKDRQVILHFGAVDYRAWVYVNGEFVGFHEGGGTPFSFDITHCLTGKDETVTVRVHDPSSDETIPRGKQFWEEEPASIWYTRTTGIWQTVWLESVHPVHFDTIRFTPDVDGGNIQLEWEVQGDYIGKQVDIEISFQNKIVAMDSVTLQETYTKRSINLFNHKIFRTGYHHDGWCWTPENPNLFDCVLTLKEKNEVLDKVTSYFGMRKIHTENGMVFLNNKPYYQKLVLDQGYWPEGLLTAPADEAFVKDIELAKEMGFNGCRKHQKFEDPRFFYWADRLGFLVWAECASSASYSEKSASRLTGEWMEAVERDYNHPSIITWVPLNESWGIPNVRIDKQQQNHSLAMYHLLKALDPTRLVISNDGWELTRTDICAVHNYNHGSKEEVAKQEVFRQSLSTKEQLLQSMPAKRNIYAEGFRHEGEPIILTEFGGIGYKVGDDSGWGYTSVSGSEEFLEDYKRIIGHVYQSEILHGYCYTQLTDVEQEINGLLTYDREPKCDLQEIRKINEQWHDEIVKKEKA